MKSKKVEVTNKAGDKVTRYMPIFDAEFERLASGTTLDNPGFCIRCGAEAEGCEPDARRYECENCGERGVYGLEELVMMNWISLEDETAVQS